MKRSIYLIMLSLIISASLACAGETVTETIVEEKIVEVPVDREVIKEVEVEVEKVVTKEKIVEKIVPPPDYKPGNRGDVARDDTLIIQVSDLEQLNGKVSIILTLIHLVDWEE